MTRTNESANITLRLACQDDCLSIYRWRNDARARRFLRNKDEIAYQDHQKWFSSVIIDPNVRIYYALVGGTGVGQIRFDKRENKVAEVSITVDPKEQGKSYGTKIIQLGSIRYLQEVRDVDTLKACIMHGNIASLKAFERAGYKKFNDDGVWFEFRTNR